MVEALVYGVLHQHLALPGGGPRDVDHHVGVCVLEEDALGDGSGLLRDAQAPLDLFGTGVLLAELQDAIAVRVEEIARALAFGDEEDVGILGRGAAFDAEELPRSPIAIGKLDFFGEVFEDEGGEGMHHLVGVLLVDVLDHPDLVEVFIVGLAHAGSLPHVVLRFLGAHHEGSPRPGLHDLVVVSLLQLDLLHNITHTTS